MKTLIRETAELFRFYEQSHRDKLVKLPASQDAIITPEKDAILEKVERNRTQAEKLEALLANWPDQLFQAREEFLSMIADGTLTLELDGDETGDCSKFILTTGWQQMRDLIDALEIPQAKITYAAESSIVEARITAAVETPAEPPKPQPDEKLSAYAPKKWQWFRDGEPIPGANDETYTLTEGDIDCNIQRHPISPPIELVAKCEGCSEPATLCETCAGDRFATEEGF